MFWEGERAEGMVDRFICRVENREARYNWIRGKETGQANFQHFFRSQNDCTHPGLFWY